MVTRSLHQTEKKQQDYYNSIADVYDQHYHNPYALKYRYSLYSQILKNIDLSKLNVLDAMCGGGENTGFFVGKVASQSALDLSQRQCEIFAERYPSVNIKCASVTDTGYSDNSFDLVVTDSLHHTHPYFDDTIEELHRIIKPGGKLMIWEPSAGSIMNRLRQIWYKFDGQYFESNESAVSLKKLLEDHKSIFELEKANFGGNLAYLLVQESMVFRIPTKAIEFYAPALIKLDRFIEKFQTELTSCWVLAILQKK